MSKKIKIHVLQSPDPSNSNNDKFDSKKLQDPFGGDLRLRQSSQSLKRINFGKKV